MILTKDEIKQKLGPYAANLIPAGSTIGLGTGTTVYWLIQALAEKIKEGFSCGVVPTSRATEEQARAAGIRIVDLNDAGQLMMTIDGADEADPGFALIKGGGAALLQEKMVAGASTELIVIMDEEKYVSTLGAFKLPVEVIPAGWNQVKRRIGDIWGVEPALREKAGQPLLTDHGHYILDCPFKSITDPAGINTSLHLIPGVVETGLFVNMATSLVIGYNNGEIRRLDRDRNAVD